MKRRLLLTMCIAMLAGCGAMGGPRTVVIGEAELQTRLAREFPKTQRLLDVVDVTVAAPRLTLLPERNRIAGVVDFTVTDRFSARPMRGWIALDHALRLEPQDGSVRLDDVRVDRVQLESASATLPLPALRLGGLLAERLLDDLVIWRARPDQLERMRAAGLNAGVVNVTPRGIEITLTAPATAR